LARSVILFDISLPFPTENWKEKDSCKIHLQGEPKMSPKRTPGSPVPPVRSAMGVIIFIGALLLLMLLWRGIEIITDWYWFQEVGYERVFSVTF
jgi:hypothetical protein